MSARCRQAGKCLIALTHALCVTIAATALVGQQRSMIAKFRVVLTADGIVPPTQGAMLYSPLFIFGHFVQPTTWQRVYLA